MSAAFDDVLVVSMNVANGLLDKLKIDTRLSTADQAVITALQVKIDASENLTRREVNQVRAIIEKALTTIAKTA
jgi:hypothetical protein